MGLEAVNLALEELAYSGKSLPRVFFANDLVVNGTPRVGGFAPDWEGNSGQPALFMDMGNRPAEKCFGAELLSHLMQNGWDNDKINKLALVDALFEEAYHYVDFTKGQLPVGMGPQGKLPGYDNYYDQPHEAAAREFAERMVATHFDSLISGKSELYRDT